VSLLDKSPWCCKGLPLFHISAYRPWHRIRLTAGLSPPVNSNLDFVDSPTPAHEGDIAGLEACSEYIIEDQRIPFNILSLISEEDDGTALVAKNLLYHDRTNTRN